MRQEDERFDELSEEQQMARLMGFGDFETTKGKKCEDNHTTAARGAMAKTKQREYRQYMNRKVIRKDGLMGMAGKGSGRGFGKGGKGGGKGRH